MSLIVATTVALMLWIVLWAIGFGRSGDAFIVTVIPIVLITVVVRTALRKSGGDAP
ncbi:hypothetical protein NBH00_16915 [Paraconexibacter antarcticus]|uniref:Lmo0937 family membrane protein n=1 Tax=Paraconexibacter antarcticus TaxID=2949664 RepID=A0ABY5DM72_9ACTN|nr:hypothetical protein [Paraconexibacter antarcticus]UTI63035.1 hypothetical protein NBH00_16915 [Paraconexibacter antarcticus]